jgi:malonate-semialdehyde dehydrogenase (acetylating)/methylmalonate-semialdehyde dehydrogenase
MSSPELVNNYIGGEYAPPIKGAYMDVLNPATDEVIAKVAVSTAEDVDAAVARAKQVWNLSKLIMIRHGTAKSLPQ